MQQTSNTDVDVLFRSKILKSLTTVQQWENSELFAQVRQTHIPWKALRDPSGPYSRPQDASLMGTTYPTTGNAVFLQRFCRWFQQDFMTWVNTPPCVTCGSTECQMKQSRGPETQEELQGGASRVEVYYCPTCQANTTTFPRYNQVAKLLETRRGRCGEYANLFGFFCRAVGFETRYVLDWSDHVWTEVRVGDHWIMTDSCEGVIDEPSMYEHGWGKKQLSYMIAMAVDHVVDITPRYTRRFMSDDFQNRRRQHTSSEAMCAQIVQQIDQNLRRNLSATAVEELNRWQALEQADLARLQQAMAWTPAETYGRGRISGSTVWKQSRNEGGDPSSKQEESNDADVASFEVEAFSPPLPSGELSLQVHPHAMTRHGRIVVGGTACAIGEANSISLVVVDEVHLGCVLQSKALSSWEAVQEFVNHIPSHRIILMVGKVEPSEAASDDVFLSRLGGWQAEGVVTNGVAFIGQVDLNPDWAYCASVSTCTGGYEVVLPVSIPSEQMKLRTERCTAPQRISGRLPEDVMPIKTQLLASEHQKRLAFGSLLKARPNRYTGYTTRPNYPVYLLDATSYPFSKMEPTVVDVVKQENAWNTFHLLPPALVPPNDEGIDPETKDVDAPAYEVPLETDFFNRSLGTQLFADSSSRLPTGEALHNARLIGLYFSAHWCPPCKRFTPMLAELYVHLKDHYPTHGLEIVFVSSDRDPGSFQHYFGTMPWQAIPFDQLQFVKPQLSMQYGVRGIPALVILDAVSGQVVVPPNDARNDVVRACQGGEETIEQMLESWFQRVPQESKEILSMLEISCQEERTTEPDKSKEATYLYSEAVSSPKSTDDTAVRVKELFEELVSKGTDPTAAAAEAIQLVANERKNAGNLPPGILSGKAIRCQVCSDDGGLENVMTKLLQWNSKGMVQDLLTIALKYVRNASKEPWSPKFRTMKGINKVADVIMRVEGGLKVLQVLGFEVFGTSQDFKACIPASVDLQELEDRLEQALLDSSSIGA
eukprot:Nitzschia sp. Nitz4//scaffold374_size14026//5689//8782//NITZ4_008959-RA/size14026-augustus-gene-0.11-mRNA-1//1//CDS//3329549623//8137//frame0